MSSKTLPLRIHVAMLNSLRAIDILGGGKNQITKIDAQLSRSLETQTLESPCQFIRSHLQRLDEMYEINWTAKGDSEAKTVSEILKGLESDECPDAFLKSITIIKPWTTYDQNLMENRQINVPFIFDAHPFKPSVFARLKGRMPSFALYSRMKEIRKILSVDLDDETKKRWRDILLINYPHKSLTNQDIRQIWQNDTSHILLKESQGKFDLMEVGESRGV